MPNNLNICPIIPAVESGSKECVEIFIKNGCDIESKDIYGRTPLLIAVQNQFVDIVDILISNGAEINVYDPRFSFVIVFVKLF